MPRTPGVALRAWIVKRADFDSDQAFQDAVAYELAQIAWFGDRIGVGLAASPVRRKLEDGRERETIAWVFQPETVPFAGEWQPATVDLGTDDDAEVVEPAAEPVPAST